MVLAMAGKTSILVWDVPADREEPWRRFVQELSGPHHEEYAQSRRRLGISAESIWLAPRRSGGGVAIVCLEAEDPDWTPERALREFAASDDPFDSWYRRRMGELFGCEFARSPRVAGGELLFGWREAPDEAEQGLPEGS
jgi:hypothetical protein